MKKYFKVLLVVVLFAVFTATGCMASHYGHSGGMAQHSSGCH